MIAVIIGKVIIAAVAILNGSIGADWHIGFPVLSRVIWGMRGSYLAILQRIVLGLTWFCVQSWTGGLCITGKSIMTLHTLMLIQFIAILSAIFPSFQYMENTLPASSNTTTPR
jgi:NCS1 family nucleobase:cation symporter-1